MTLLNVMKQVEKVVVDNSPNILAGLGAAGVVVTGVLAYRAGYRVGLDKNAGHYEPLLEGKEPETYTTLQTIKTYWPEFVPPVVIGATSIACVIGGNRVGTRRAAAVAAAYTLSEKAYHEFREKVEEKFGETKTNKVRDEIAQKRVTDDPVSSKQVIITGNGDVLCYDSLTGRYFMSNMESIKRAENEINKQILDCDYASLSEFYDKIGLSATTYSEEVGWKYENQLDIYFSTVLSEDGKPCLALNYTMEPIRNYYKMQ